MAQSAFLALRYDLHIGKWMKVRSKFCNLQSDTFFGKMSTCCFLYGVSYKQELTVFPDMFSTKFADMIINSMTKMRFIGAEVTRYYPQMLKGFDKAMPVWLLGAYTSWRNFCLFVTVRPRFHSDYLAPSATAMSKMSTMVSSMYARD